MPHYDDNPKSLILVSLHAYNGRNAAIRSELDWHTFRTLDYQ